MFQIILWILKIIGILLAAILGIAVLLICIVLFVPVRYRIEAESAGTFESIDAHARFSWLLHLFSGYFYVIFFFLHIRKKAECIMTKTDLESNRLEKTEPDRAH